ncbi:MAG TPA: flagellar basal body rod C-terminal domain-containing protein, partial [Acidobacteriota bacterium]|nr:flagellar basal body rod C-terminal domain-containing protein [Acidobacteriota bacterium]
AGEAGNNTNALAFVALRTQPLASLGDQTINGYAAGVIAGVGTDVKSVSAGLEASQTIVDSLDQQRAAISGVSLDEEAADLVRWQQAFQASARFLQMSNQMIDEVLNDLAR